jgi:hypothetical protein
MNDEEVSPFGIKGFIYYVMGKGSNLTLFGKLFFSPLLILMLLTYITISFLFCKK